MPLRFDDVPPGRRLRGRGGRRHSRADPRRGQRRPLRARRRARSPTAASTSRRWTELPTKLQAEAEAARATPARPHPGARRRAPTSSAPRPSTAPATRASTTLRADGTQMAIRKTPPPVAPAGSALPPAPKAKTRLFARLRGGHGRGDSLTVAFGAPALLSGRLTRADGAGIAGRELRVVARPSRGALATTAVEPGPDRRARRLRAAAARPGPRAGSRVSYRRRRAGSSRCRAGLRSTLRVRSGVSLRRRAADAARPGRRCA